MTHAAPASDQVDDRIEQLARLLAAAVARIDLLEAEVATLKRENADLRRENADLKRENADLRARLGQNSNNSSKPPSSDGPEVKRPATPSTGRKRGGQLGHEGAKRVRLTPTRVVDHWPESCRRCRHPLPQVATTLDVDKWHQVVELPVVVPEVVEHRAHAVKCVCGTTTEATLPGGVVLHGFGPRVAAYVAYLTGRCRLSKRQVVELFEEMFGTAISLGSVCSIEQDVAAALAAPVEEAREAVRQQTIIHADETGWREDKKKAWLWVAATSVAIVFKVARSRGAIVAKDLLGETFAGILVSDRWSAYNWLDAARRQLCWAHLLRDMQGMVDRGGAGGLLGQQMLDEVAKMFEWWAEVRDGTMSRRNFTRKMVPVRREVERLLLDASLRAEKKTAGMCAEILKLNAALWTFVEVDGVEPTNNTSERAVRPAVLWRKGCFGTDSEGGSRFVERILTAVATVRLRGGSVLGYLTSACEAHRTTGRVPSLLAV